MTLKNVDPGSGALALATLEDRLVTAVIISSHSRPTLTISAHPEFSNMTQRPAGCSLDTYLVS